MAVEPSCCDPGRSPARIARPACAGVAGDTRRRVAGDAGQALVPALVAMGIVLVLVVAVCQVLVFLYGRGSVRAALDEGARAGARRPAGVRECEQRAGAAIEDLMGGPLGDGLVIHCRLTDDGRRVTATATGTFEGWLGGVTDYSFTLTASAARQDR